MTTVDAKIVDESMVTVSENDILDGITNCFDKYDMTHEKRGVAYIFKNETFRNLPPRPSSSRDTNTLKTALIHLGFDEKDITVYNDATADEMLGYLKGFQEDNPGIDRNIDCFILAIMSHGKENDIICGYEGEIGLGKLLPCLRPNSCPVLTGIPKVIFIETSRVTESDGGIERKDADTFGFKTLTTIPVMADMLVFHWSFVKCPSMRFEETGSWFMQSLSELLERYGTENDIMKLLTAVCNHVSSNILQISMREDQECIDVQQIPRIMSALRKELKFEPGLASLKKN